MVHATRSSTLLFVIALSSRLLLAAPASAGDVANLLRNADFQDDWTTLIPQAATLHWSYSTAYQNRRDYNPDGWTSKGGWDWRNADAPAGERRLVLRGPDAEISQRVNWVAVHDDRSLEGFPDAGGFPSLATVRSERPLAMVRDLTFRVRIKGNDVPDGGASIALALCPPGKPSSAEPLGTPTEPTAMAEAPLPHGSFDWSWVEVKLSAAAWKKAAETAAAKGAGGLPLPASVRVAVRYRAPRGEIEIARAELVAEPSSAPNLLENGGFENLVDGGLPAGWSGPEKYTYFPAGHFYLFNTWHNEGFPNRGHPAVDSLVVHGGRASLRVPVLAGDEIAVRSAPILLRQKEPRLVEVSTWVKTDRVNQIQIDAVDERGERLDGFDFVNKALTSIGTDDWRLLRQVFRPRRPVDRLRVLLCVRGVNGYTLGGGAPEPQNNAAGTVWWDDVRVFEPETTTEEIVARTAIPRDEGPRTATLRLTRLDLGERLFGENVLTATIVNAGPSATLALELVTVSPRGAKRRFVSAPQRIGAGGEAPFRLPYVLDEPSPAYGEYRAELAIVAPGDKRLGSTELAFATWTAPVALELGGLYLEPDARELVRLNLGFSAATMARVAWVRLQIARGRTGEVLATKEIAAGPDVIRARREHIPKGLRGDLTNLLLHDLDVASLPVEPFDRPERKWFVRAAVLDRNRRPMASVDSARFCRLAHPPAQPPVGGVRLHGDVLEVDGVPWMPWGATYGFCPHYAGPADPIPDERRDLHDLPPWSYYDGFSSDRYDRRHTDLASIRDAPGYDAVTNPQTLERIEQRWKADNLYTATFFVVPSPGVFSPDALGEKAGGAAKLAGILDFAARAPMVVSTGPGFEEAFGRFHAASPEDLAGLEKVVDILRRRTGKPVMVADGGAWNRFEFEKVPFFDIYDPETEPLYPANLHTDLRPLLEGKDKVIWLRPQIYESVPFERWRFHAFVELMRGARGWEIAHGPADATMLRGLHAELDSLKAVVASPDPGPAVELEPRLEHWSRRYGGKTYVIAATTHPLTLGRWRWTEEAKPPGASRARVAEPDGSAEETAIERLVDEHNQRWIEHGIDSFANPSVWRPGDRLVQWVRADAAPTPKAIALLTKIDGRWQGLATWGAFDLESLRADPLFGYWFLRRFHRNAVGFIGYEGRGLAAALGYLPARATSVGQIPRPSEWVKLWVQRA